MSTRLTRYQRFVVFAAWLGLGFDMMETALANIVMPLAVPDLLGLAPGSSAAHRATAYWTGLTASIVLIGWGLGGIGFGWLSDRLGRARTVVFTMLLYSFGTALTAVSQDVGMLIVFRFLAAIGIGGEWAAGVTLVAESVPEERRVSMGTILASAGVVGALFAVGAANLLTSIDALAQDPGVAWRAMVGLGLLPAIVALLIRRGLREPERWVQAVKEPRRRGDLAALFRPGLRRRTVGGIVIVSLTLGITWIVTGYSTVVLVQLVDSSAVGSTPAELIALRTTYLNWSIPIVAVGSLAGTFLAAPIAERFGRRTLYMGTFALSALMVAGTFYFDWSLAARIVLMGLTMLPISAATSSFAFYLPELFPVEMRSTGASVCMNAGRFLTAAGPLAVGAFSKAGISLLHVLAGAAVIPALGLIAVLVGAGVETRGETLD